MPINPVDYIVVGAGSSGCVLANRLSEDPENSVCLIEAGPKDKSPWIHLPIGYGKTMWDPKLNWKFETEPDPGMNQRKIYWPRGKCLGGSSSINGLIFIRGQKEDYDGWKALGNKGWGWDDRSRLNVNGSGISLGHPIGATGGRILANLVRELHRRNGRYGLETMCIGGGQGIAAVFERA